MAHVPPERDWRSINAAAASRRVSPKTIRRMIARGELYAERVGPKLIRVDLNSLTGRPLGGGAA